LAISYIPKHYKNDLTGNNADVYVPYILQDSVRI